MNIVLDASVVIKWFKDSDEEYAGLALSIQDKKLSGDIEIIVPDLFFPEVLNAFLTNPGFKKEEIAIIKDSLIKMNMKVVYPESEILGDSIIIAKANSLTFYDSLYIATAEAHDAFLYTEDKEILSCSKKYDFIKHIKDFNL
jgi:predicted nucleic acid-binding protein